jgi:hypothetical protein
MSLRGKATLLDCVASGHEGGIAVASLSPSVVANLLVCGQWRVAA